MSAPANRSHGRASAAHHPLTIIKETREMKAEEVDGMNRLGAVGQEISKVKEAFEMKLEMYISDATNRVSNGLSNMNPAKLLGGLAVGAFLMTATFLPLGPINADGPSSSLVSEDIVTAGGGDQIPGDVWMFDAPFYEDFTEASSVGVQGPVADAWMFDAPFYENFGARES